MKLQDIIGKIFAEKESSGERHGGWHVAIFGFLSNSNLPDVLQKSGVSLRWVIEQIFAKKGSSGERHKGWDSAIFGFFDNPNYSDILLSQSVVDGAWIARHMREVDSGFRIYALSSTFSNVSSFPELHELVSFRQWACEKKIGERREDFDALYRWYFGDSDEHPAYREFSSIENFLQRCFAYELYLYYKERGEEVSPEVIRRFVGTKFARGVIEDLFHNRRNTFTEAVIAMLPRSRESCVIERIVSEGEGGGAFSLSDVYKMRSELVIGERVDVAHALEQLRGRYREAGSPREELQTVLTGQVPRTDTFVRELLQNATDAMRRGDASGDAIRVQIGTDEGGGRAVVCVEDEGGGMDSKTLLTKFFLPLVPDPEKRRGNKTGGGIGWGAFTMFAVADEVEIATVKDEKETAVRVKVTRGQTGEIYDLVVTSWEEKEAFGKKNGTRIQVYLPEDVFPQMEQIGMRAAVELYGRPLIGREGRHGAMRLIVDGKELSAARRIPIGEVTLSGEGEEQDRVLRLTATRKDEDAFARALRNGIYLTDPHRGTMDLLSFIPQEVLQFYEDQGLNLQIEVPSMYQKTMAGTGLAISSMEMQALRQHILSLFLQDIAKRTATGRGHLPFMADDALYVDHEGRYGVLPPSEALSLVDKLTRNEPLTGEDLSHLEKDETLRHVIMHLPFQFTQEDLNGVSDEFIRSLGTGRAYTLSEIRQTIQEKIRREKLSESVSSSPLLQEAVSFASSVGEETYRAICEGTALLDTSSHQNLRELVDRLNAYAHALFDGESPYQIAIANPQKARSTVWMGNTLGLPLTQAFIDRVNQKGIDGLEEENYR
ncbi:MAG: ATP-binding protein, partial [Candidatus Caldarchaeum sp.]